MPEASKQVYTGHSCSRYLTMLMLLGAKSQNDVAKIQCQQNRAARIILKRKTSKNAFHLLNWLSLACEGNYTNVV